MDQAVAVALQRNRDVDRGAAGDRGGASWTSSRRGSTRTRSSATRSATWCSGKRATRSAGAPARPGFFEQPVQTVGVSEIIDVWAKRSARMPGRRAGRRAPAAAGRGRAARDRLRRPLGVRRGGARAVASGSSRATSRDRYAETVRLSQARFKAGDISEAELRKIELEGLRYQNAVIDAEMQLDVARGKLAALLASRRPRELPAERLAEPDASGAARPRRSAALDARALGAAARPARRGRGAVAGRRRVASAKREALPDISLGAAYTHSDFTVSGDNPNTLGAFSCRCRCRSSIATRPTSAGPSSTAARADNDAERLRIAVTREVAEAVRRTRAATLLASSKAAGANVLGMPTGTSDRAACSSAPRPRCASPRSRTRPGAVSLLELLEAQRTYLETRAQYLRAHLRLPPGRRST